MKQTLDEKAFVFALTTRDADALAFAMKFNPRWLGNADLQPVLKEIFEFRKKAGQAPSIRTLHDIMKDQDEDIYNQRWKVTLMDLENYAPDPSQQTRALDVAKTHGTAMAAETLISDAKFKQDLDEGDGEAVMNQLATFVRQWGHTNEGEGVFSIKEAIDKRYQAHDWRGQPDRIPCGVCCIDDWTNGGLRPGNLGVIIAPTGGGKSAFLMNTAYYGAAVVQTPTLFITNELTLNEQTERFIVRMQQKRSNDTYTSLTEVQDDPFTAIISDRIWATQLDRRLYVASVDINQTADSLEEMIQQLRLTRGFKPGLIVIDYLERMTPVRKVSYEREHLFIGQIARELIQLAKRTDSLCWTAVQTNRSGLYAGTELNMTHAQGSIRQLQEAAFVGTMMKCKLPLTEDGREGVHALLFKEEKQRHAKDEGRSAYLEHDLGRMYISKTYVEVPKDVEPEEDEASDTPDHEQKPTIHR